MNGSLDTSIRVVDGNQVQYKYYEKPTTTNTTIRKDSAMAENCKIQILSQDLVRRLHNTKEDLPVAFKMEIIDGYAQKVTNGGYSLDQTRRIIIAGIKGYYAKLRRRRKEEGRYRIHLTAEESRGHRIRKKLIGKSSWFRNTRKRNQEDVVKKTSGTKRKSGKSGRAPSETSIRTRSVLFIPQTSGGELARRTREVLERLQPAMGYKVKVVERTGTSLQQKLSQTAIWAGEKCGRDYCVTCNQGGEELPLCTRSSVVYENICVTCNPSARSKGELGEQENVGVPSLYVGESGRSIQERASEHWSDYRRGEDKSHIKKHQALQHQEEAPNFIMKVVSYPRSALTRQVQEAVTVDDLKQSEPEL